MYIEYISIMLYIYRIDNVIDTMQHKCKLHVLYLFHVSCIYKIANDLDTGRVTIRAVGTNVSCMFAYVFYLFHAVLYIYKTANGLKILYYSYL